MRIKFIYCPSCGKGHRFKVVQCEKCGYGKPVTLEAKPEVEAAAAELLAPDADTPSPFGDSIPEDLFE